MEKIILTGGGTAGHITPNIALLPFLKEFEVHYVGQPDSMEKELISKQKGVIFHEIESVKLVRSLSPKNLLIPFKLMRAKAKAYELLEEIKPKVIFSKGGYASLPVMLAADKSIPLILHESDYSFGLANKMVMKRCKYVLTSFSHLSEGLSNGKTSGCPLRQEIYSGQKQAAEKECNLRGRKNLLIFGGSLGAQKINETVFKSLNELAKKYNVVHIVGKGNQSNIKHDNYFSLPFSNNIADYFAWADLCVTRGGANALYELIALKKPSLCIPLPKGNSRGDQEDNAAYFEKLGYIKVLKQDLLNPETFIFNINELDKYESILKTNMENAKNIDGTRFIADLIKKTALSNID